MTDNCNWTSCRCWATGIYYNRKLPGGQKIIRMDTLGIEPNTSRMLSERDNQLHHVPPKAMGCLQLSLVNGEAPQGQWARVNNGISCQLSWAVFRSVLGLLTIRGVAMLYNFCSNLGASICLYYVFLSVVWHVSSWFERYLINQIQSIISGALILKANYNVSRNRVMGRVHRCFSGSPTPGCTAFTAILVLRACIKTEERRWPMILATVRLQTMTHLNHRHLPRSTAPRSTKCTSPYWMVCIVLYSRWNNLFRGI